MTYSSIFELRFILFKISLIKFNSFSFAIIINTIPENKKNPNNIILIIVPNLLFNYKF